MKPTSIHKYPAIAHVAARAIFYPRSLALALAIGASALLSSCDRQLEPETRLVYLAPHAPCEPGEPRFGEPNCFSDRRRDAVAVLRVPGIFGDPTKKDLPVSLSGSFVLMPDKVLTAADPGYFEKEKIGIRNFPRFDPDGPTYITAFTAVWGWSLGVHGGHEMARFRMKLIPERKINGPYVEIASYFDGFKTYGEQQCIGRVRRFGSGGQVTPASTCDRAEQFLLPIDRPSTFVVCPVPEIQNGQLMEGRACVVASYFELKKVGGRSFYVHFSYYAEPNWLRDGHWTYIDQRIRDWIKSMDVTDKYLLGKT